MNYDIERLIQAQTGKLILANHIEKLGTKEEKALLLKLEEYLIQLARSNKK